MYSPIAAEQLKALIAHDRWAIHGTSSRPLFKGSNWLDSDHVAYMFKSIPGARPSKTANYNGHYYDWLLNGLPSWKCYPARNASLIGTTKHSNASSYARTGSVWRIVLPNDGRIAICPACDIWYSFNANLSQLGIDGYDVALYRLNDSIREAQLNYGLVAATDYLQLMNLLEEIRTNARKHSPSLTFITRRFIERIASYNGDLEVWLSELLSPSSNAFNLYSTEEYARVVKPMNNEIWSDSLCLLVSEDWYRTHMPEHSSIAE